MIGRWVLNTQQRKKKEKENKQGQIPPRTPIVNKGIPIPTNPKKQKTKNNLTSKMKKKKLKTET